MTVEKKKAKNPQGQVMAIWCICLFYLSVLSCEILLKYRNNSCENKFCPLEYILLLYLEEMKIDEICPIKILPDLLFLKDRESATSAAYTDTTNLAWKEEVVL